MEIKQLADFIIFDISQKGWLGLSRTPTGSEWCLYRNVEFAWPMTYNECEMLIKNFPKSNQFEIQSRNKTIVTLTKA